MLLSDVARSLVVSLLKQVVGNQVPAALNEPNQTTCTDPPFTPYLLVCAANYYNNGAACTACVASSTSALNSTSCSEWCMHACRASAGAMMLLLHVYSLLC